jgi:hypothetical protein
MAADRERLLSVLRDAIGAYRAQNPTRSLLSSPDSTLLEPVTAATRECGAFQKVAGKVLYTGGGGPILDAPLLSERLFQRAEWRDEYEDAVDWLLRVLTTTEAPGLFIAVAWGLSLDSEVKLSGSRRLVLFETMPDSSMKTRITERSKACYDGSVWLSHTYFEKPHIALIEEIPDFPYIGSDGACFRKIARLENEIQDFWVTIEAASIGHPLAVGCWFQYVDPELDFAGWQNTITWMLPEIHPRIARHTPVAGAAVEDDLRRYAALPRSLGRNLLRSMKRFTLSQCRHQIIDRIN